MISPKFFVNIVLIFVFCRVVTSKINCTENYDVSTNCTTCIDGFDINENCLQCKDNYNPPLCDSCNEFFDQSEDCRVCISGYERIGRECKKENDNNPQNFPIDKEILIIACSVGGAVLLVLFLVVFGIAICFLVLCVRNCKVKKENKIISRNKNYELKECNKLGSGSSDEEDIKNEEKEEKVNENKEEEYKNIDEDDYVTYVINKRRKLREKKKIKSPVALGKNDSDLVIKKVLLNRSSEGNEGDDSGSDESSNKENEGENEKDSEDSDENKDSDSDSEKKDSESDED